VIVHPAPGFPGVFRDLRADRKRLRETPARGGAALRADSRKLFASSAALREDHRGGDVSRGGAKGAKGGEQGRAVSAHGA
jgi:hypothetical protein